MIHHSETSTLLTAQQSTMATASPPRASPTPASTSAAPAETPVYTYHCVCTQLLFATTTPLSSLPRRGASNPDTTPLDRAYILPLPTRPPEEDDEDRHYALLLHVQPDRDRKPRIVQREDGLEKRYPQRCARCRCAVGYHLDWSHWGSEGEGKSGARGDVAYLLEGAVVGTEEMKRGEGGDTGAGR